MKKTIFETAQSKRSEQRNIRYIIAAGIITRQSPPSIDRRQTGTERGTFPLIRTEPSNCQKMGDEQLTNATEIKEDTPPLVGGEPETIFHWSAAT